MDEGVKYCAQTATLPWLKGKGQACWGRNWLEALNLNWYAIFWSHNQSLTQVLDKYKSVFEPGLGKVKGYQAKILIDADSAPKYCKVRTVPYFYKKVEKELDRLVKEGHWSLLSIWSGQPQWASCM